MSAAFDIVQSVLGLERNDSWSLDVVEPLAMVTAVKTSYGVNHPAVSPYVEKKGWVVDLENKVVVAPFYGEVTVREDEPVPTDDAADASVLYQRGYEGTIIRVMLYGGKKYVFTSRKLDCSKSRWGTKKSFRELFSDLGGDQVMEELYDAKKTHSPFVHFFILNHPDLLISSKQPMNTGALVYLGCYSCGTCAHVPEEQVDLVKRDPKWTFDYKEAEEKKICFAPGYITLEEAGRVYHQGYSEKVTVADPRVAPGEFFMRLNLTDGVPKLTKWCSPGYMYRCKVRGDEPNVLHRFYHLAQDVKLSDEEYDQKYLWLAYEAHYETKRKAERGEIKSWDVGTPKEMRDQGSKFENICKNMLLCVPGWRQATVVNYYYDYKNTQKNVVNWLTDVYYQRPEEKEVIPRGWKLLELAVNYAKTRKVEHVSAKLLKKNLGFLLENERGDSLYKLRKNMNQMRKKLEQEEKVEQQ
jgi:hypothetical protein